MLFLVHSTKPTIKFQIFCVVWATVGILVCHCNFSSNVAKYELFMCHIHRSESTSIFGTNDVICREIWLHLWFLPYQFSIFDDVGSWQPCYWITCPARKSTHPILMEWTFFKPWGPWRCAGIYMYLTNDEYKFEAITRKCQERTS